METKQAAILASHLSFHTEDAQPLREANLRVEAGEVVALLGPNGAGKSTLVDLITGMLRPTTGSVKVFGQSFRQTRGRVGIVFEYTPLFDFLTPREVIKYYAAIYDVPFATAEPIVEQLQMTGILDKPSHVLSNGERKKVGIVLALLHDPDLLILDEATANLDPFVRTQCWELFRRPGRTILFSTHHWEEAENFADRIVFICSGVTYRPDTPAAFLSEKYLPSTRKVVLNEKEFALAAVQASVTVREEGKIYVFPANVTDFLQQIKDEVQSISILPKELKDVFLYLTATKS